MNNISISVPAIHCNHCAHTIKMELSELPGVDNVEVDIDGKEVIVNFQDPTNEKDIRNLLVEIGYPPTQ